MPSRRRVLVVALVVGIVTIIGVAFAIRRRVDDTTSPKPPPPGPTTPIVSSGTPPTTAAATPRTAGATSVAAFGADGRGNTDDTAAFGAAMTAARASAVRFPRGPTGQPQAVVRVPPGTYRIFQLRFESNLRMEVDAGAVLEQAGNKPLVESQHGGGPSLILWDGPPGAALKNVSIIGVGSAGNALKRFQTSVEPGWNLDRSFTFDLNTQRTGGDNYDSAMQLNNVDGFRIANVFTIQNGTPSDPTDPTTGKIGPYPRPTSSRAVFVLSPRNDSPIGGPYYDPHNGTIRNVYNVNGPYGYGPTQVTSGHNLNLSTIFSRGGTALRLETDATLRKNFGGELRGVVADTIVGAGCNRAVSFAPHAQRNFDVHVSHVAARNCQQGVIQSVDESLDPSQRGAFTNTTLSDVAVVGGHGAQMPVSGRPGLWAVGSSARAFATDRGASWSVMVTRPSCRGSFGHSPDAINVGGDERAPLCT
jgi:hypothetical protein